MMRQSLFLVVLASGLFTLCLRAVGQHGIGDLMQNFWVFVAAPSCQSRFCKLSSLKKLANRSNVALHTPSFNRKVNSSM
jgi:hypothetical protein